MTNGSKNREIFSLGLLPTLTSDTVLGCQLVDGYSKQKLRNSHLICMKSRDKQMKLPGGRRVYNKDSVGRLGWISFSGCWLKEYLQDMEVDNPVVCKFIALYSHCKHSHCHCQDDGHTVTLERMTLFLSNRQKKLLSVNNCVSFQP